jgi:membrane-associated phospholipid phosphatase
MGVNSTRAISRSLGILLLAALIFYAWLAVLAHRFPYFSWDLSLAHFIQAIRLPGFCILMIAISALGSGWLAAGTVAAASIALLIARLRVEALICVMGVGLGSLINRLLKAISARPRPSSTLVEVMGKFHHESFPSGHVVFFIELFGFLFVITYLMLRHGLLRSSLLALFSTLILLIGVSRVYLGAHWPSDVIGAYLVGGVWLTLMIEAYHRFKSRQTFAARQALRASGAAV